MASSRPIPLRSGIAPYAPSPRPEWCFSPLPTFGTLAQDFYPTPRFPPTSIVTLTSHPTSAKVPELIFPLSRASPNPLSMKRLSDERITPHCSVRNISLFLLPHRQHYFLNFLPSPTSPTKPHPTKNKAPGSGTGVTIIRGTGSIILRVMSSSFRYLKNFGFPSK